MLLLPGHPGGYLCLFLAETGIITERSRRRARVLVDSVTGIVILFSCLNPDSLSDRVRSVMPVDRFVSALHCIRFPHIQCHRLVPTSA